MKRDLLVEQITNAVEQHRDELVALCARLIGIESVTGNELAVQKEVRAIFDEAGLEVDFWVPDMAEMHACPWFSETGETFENRPVVVGTLRGKDGQKGKSLLVNGHVDVVTAEPLEKWETNPFEPVVRDGKLYGRGASDMKTGLATAIFCALLLKREFGGTNGDLFLVSVPGEENGGNGTVASLIRGYVKADGAIFPEPTSNQIQPAHRGAAFWRVHIEGKASHGGTKYKGVSAVEKGVKVVQALQELENRRNAEICSKNPLYADYPLSAPVTVGIFNGGQFTSGVPETCMIEGCIEYVPGEKSADVVRSFEDAVARACDGDAWMLAHPPKVEWFGLLYEPAATDVHNELIETAVDCYEAALGEKPVVNGFEAGTDMRLLCNHFGVPGFMFGAGDIAMAHAPNEYVNLEALVKNAKVMAVLMARWCGIPASNQ